MDLLESSGIEVRLHMASSRGVESSLANKVKASISGVYNPAAYREMKRVVSDFEPDVAHAHNVYPNLSPSVLAACQDMDVPVVMSIHSQVLTCPTWFHFRDGQICELCVGGKEYNCVRTNCRGNMAESAVYATRSALVRKLGLITGNVDLFVTMSEFMRERLRLAGITDDRIAVVPNFVEIPSGTNRPSPDGYVAYAGRLSPEKGVDTLLAAARLLPGVQFKIAGDGPLRDSLMSSAPGNTSFLGLLQGAELEEFYRGAFLVVAPSVAFEVFPLVVLEAMSFGLPVIASDVGAIPEIVDDGVTGRLFGPGDVQQLASLIQDMYRRPGDAVSMGQRGRQMVVERYAPGLFIERTLAVYRRLIASMRLA